jgi:hypothetical protein
MANDLYIALVHYPVVNKEGRVVTTSVTNFDLHDLSRTGATFGVKRVFIVTPVEVQRNMVTYIRDYWREGVGAIYNPDRKEAMGGLLATPDLVQTRLTIKELSGIEPLLVGTTAKRQENSLSYGGLRAQMQSKKRPFLLVFGTGHGLTADLLESCDAVLAPIDGAGAYNHLPVRSAVAIILDRLVSHGSVTEQQ